MKHKYFVTFLVTIAVSVFLLSPVFAAEDEYSRKNRTVTLQNVVISDVHTYTYTNRTVTATQFVVTYEDGSARTVNVDENCLTLLKHFGDSRVNVIVKYYKGMQYTNKFRFVKKIILSDTK